MNRSCEKKDLLSNSEVERCVLCWKETDVFRNTPIDQRAYYQEGQGQLCARCYYELYGAGVFRRLQTTER